MVYWHENCLLPSCVSSPLKGAERGGKDFIIMAITKKDVEYIANLSRLTITEEEKEEYTKQLSEILEHVNRLQKLNTDNIEPTFYTVDMKNVMRDDVNEPVLDRQKVFDMAPSIESNGFKVPKII
jgi:aspartyl-tRNA(Asn)/glutamyl-tRNA(Gln) amidotransferase subunit C